jgi:hypothetical protein
MKEIASLLLWYALMRNNEVKHLSAAHADT